MKIEVREPAGSERAEAASFFVSTRHGPDAPAPDAGITVIRHFRDRAAVKGV